MTTQTIAVVGANGFIGSRLVEMLHLEGVASVRPVVRRASALASAARFALEGHVADALDTSALRDALAGCDAVVHCVAGDAKTIVKSAVAVYTAADAVGCRRLVYLSSACVHGQSPAPGTDERSILSDRQPIEYNNAKVRAERALRALRERGRLEVVVLRPAIVFGPRSQWIAGFADDVLAGRAYFAGDDSGVCNSLYVDNLVHAIRLAIASPRADREAYLLGDDDAPTWRALYRPFARALGARVEDLPIVPYHAPSRSLAETVDRLRSSRPVQGALMRLPERLRRGLGAFYAELSGIAENVGVQGAPALPTPSLEMTLLHGCRYRLPWRKAHEELGYSPVVTLDEALRRTVGWLAFAGYPVTGAALATLDRGGSIDAG
ncbi:MAG TPA: NAD-dependent epimerase/dehydratase family protein [Candidatus Binatia bacterium]|nr:NAD-dependent epimerase/dehydratase family protein [Candidatus Binatia bacterium]